MLYTRSFRRVNKKIAKTIKKEEEDEASKKGNMGK